MTLAAAALALSLATAAGAGDGGAPAPSAAQPQTLFVGAFPIESRLSRSMFTGGAAEITLQFDVTSAGASNDLLQAELAYQDGSLDTERLMVRPVWIEADPGFGKRPV